MTFVVASAFACIIAGTISLLEIVTSRYRTTYFLLWRQWPLYAYVAMYGVFGGILMLIAAQLVFKNVVSSPQGVPVESPWVQAVLVGISTRALMNITLFNVASGAGTVPIGISTITHLIEPFLLSELDIRVWNDVRSFLEPHASKYLGLPEVKAIIEQNIPPTLSPERRAALRADVREADTVKGAMEAFLYAVGRDTFRRSFPLDA